MNERFRKIFWWILLHIIFSIIITVETGNEHEPSVNVYSLQSDDEPHNDPFSHINDYNVIDEPNVHFQPKKIIERNEEKNLKYSKEKNRRQIPYNAQQPKYQMPPQQQQQHRQQYMNQQQQQPNGPNIVHNQFPYVQSGNSYHSQNTQSFTQAYTSASAAAMNHGTPMEGDEKTIEQFLDRLLHPKNYDRRIRPFFNSDKSISKPSVIKLNMNINTISQISEVNMEYTIDCYFRMHWYDPRLMYANSSWKHVEDITLHYDLVNKVWTPDAFFRNAKDAKSHMITVPNRLIRIYPEGKILFSQRLTLRLECPMKLQKFPLDNQTCIINIGSYGYAMKDIIFVWMDEKPVVISPKLEMPDFVLTSYNSSTCLRKFSTGSFTCLETHIHLQRDLSSYIVDIYIPSSFVVSLSFISFFIDYKSAPARAPLGVTSVLTITTMTGGVRSQLPKVSYIKAIDVWMSACLVFVFAALLEYAVVNVIARKQELKKQLKMNEKKKKENRKLHLVQKLSANNMPNQQNNEKVLMIGNRLANLNQYQAGHNHSQDHLENLLQHQNSIQSNTIQRHKLHSSNSLHVDSAVSISAGSQQSTPQAQCLPVPAPAPGPAPASLRDDAQMVDFVSSFLFPIVFIIFNIIYWMVYLNLQINAD